MNRFSLFALLLLMNAPATAEQLTIRCNREGTYNFGTFDMATNRMIWEVNRGSSFRGQIKRVTDGEIEFVLLFPGRMQTSLYYMRNEARIEGQDGNGRSVTAENCVTSPLRDVLGKWDSWGPIPLK